MQPCPVVMIGALVGRTSTNATIAPLLREASAAGLVTFLPEDVASISKNPGGGEKHREGCSSGLGRYGRDAH